MERLSLYSAVLCGFLVLVIGVFAWGVRAPLILVSIGPSAFALVSAPEETPLKQLLGSHMLGLLIGLGTGYLFGIDLAGGTTPAAFSGTGLRVAAGAVLSVVLLTGAMVLSGTRHAPACVTTLLAALGLLPGTDGLWLLAALLMLWIAVTLTSRVWGWPPAETEAEAT